VQLTNKAAQYNKNYPVMVFVHGEDYKFGDAMLYPGHVVAQKEVLVVTFNYRLGALGMFVSLNYTR
jgi:carboxylesterase type B